MPLITFMSRLLIWLFLLDAMPAKGMLCMWDVLSTLIFCFVPESDGVVTCSMWRPFVFETKCIPQRMPFTTDVLDVFFFLFWSKMQPEWMPLMTEVLKVKPLFDVTKRLQNSEHTCLNVKWFLADNTCMRKEWTPVSLNHRPANRLWTNIFNDLQGFWFFHLALPLCPDSGK